MIRRKRNKNGQFTSDVVSVFLKNGEKFKICTMCKEEKNLSEFYWIKKKDAPTSRCKICTDKINKENNHKYRDYFIKYNKKYRERNKEKSKKHYIKKKIEWIKFISNITDIKCKKCGYDKYFDALDFHHIDPQKKENILSILTKQVLTKERKIIVKEELKKGYFLCATCHREIHKKFNKTLNEIINEI